MEQPQDLQRSFNDAVWNVRRALFNYVENNNIEKMKELVELFKDKKDAKLLKNYGLSLDARNENGETPLHVACEKNKFEMAKWLIENGANINVPTDNGDMPIHYAAKFADLVLVKLLVENGVDVNVRSGEDYDSTALRLAVRCRKIDVIKFLVENGADTELRYGSSRPETVLQEAARYGYTEGAEFLIQEGANFSVTDHLGDTIIEKARYHGKKETAAAMTDAINKKIAPISKKLKSLGF